MISSVCLSMDILRKSGSSPARRISWACDVVHTCHWRTDLPVSIGRISRDLPLVADPCSSLAGKSRMIPSGVGVSVIEPYARHDDLYRATVGAVD
jgi:hypothetical protein